MKGQSVESMLAVTRGSVLSPDAWRAIVEEIVESLREHLGEAFDVDPEPAFFGTGFSLWLFGHCAHDDPEPVVWSGVLAGRDIDPGFYMVDFSQFLFDRATRDRVRAGDGSYVVHAFDVKDGEHPRWRSLGWQDDEYDEWEDVPFPLAV